MVVISGGSVFDTGAPVSGFGTPFFVKSPVISMCFSFFAWASVSVDLSVVCVKGFVVVIVADGGSNSALAPFVVSFVCVGQVSAPTLVIVFTSALHVVLAYFCF